MLFRACFEAGRLLRGNPPWHEIVPGLYLGRRLTRREAADAVLRLHIHAVLDLTSALAEPPAMRSAGAYRLLPVLDNTSPTLAELRDAAAWIARHLAAGSVYVHCAAGHGRAAAVVAAYLLSAGRAANAEDALALIRSRRPGVRLLPRQARTLRQFAVEAIRAGGGQGR
jgi:protein-tyrosine phosphatase